jgi:hypothetical protein
MFKIFCTYICRIIYIKQHLEVSGAVRHIYLFRSAAKGCSPLCASCSYHHLLTNTYAVHCGYPVTCQLLLGRVSLSADTIFREPRLAVFFAKRDLEKIKNKL